MVWNTAHLSKTENSVKQASLSQACQRLTPLLTIRGVLFWLLSLNQINQTIAESERPKCSYQYKLHTDVFLLLYLFGVLKVLFLTDIQQALFLDLIG